MSDEKVVFLAWSNTKVDVGGRDLLSCKPCKNKTYTIVWQGQDKFPLIQCAACGNHIGYMGWVDTGNGDKE